MGVDQMAIDQAKFDALADYNTSPLFSEAERAALEYATELTMAKRVQPETFTRLSKYFSEESICEIAWLVATEHLLNIANLGLNISSDGLYENIKSSTYR